MSVAVVYDQGSAVSPDIIDSLGSRDDLVVVLAPSGHAQSVRPLFEEHAAAVLDLPDDPGADDLVAALRGYDVEGVLTFSERMLAGTARLARRLNLPFHSPEVVTRLTDKRVQRRRLADAGVDTVASVQIDGIDQWPAAAATTGLPAVVKPTRGAASRSTVLVHDIDADRPLVADLLAAEGRMVVEEYLRGVDVDDPYGDYVSVETAVLPPGAAGSGRVHYAVTGKFRLAPPFRESGQFWPARLDDATRHAVLDLADRAVAALGLAPGLAHTEIKLTPSGPRMIEVNGRVGGSQPELARRAAGLDVVRLAADIARGRPVTVEPVRPDRVWFQLYIPGPTTPGTLRAARGGAEVRRIPAVSRYRTLIRPGGQMGGTATRLLDLTCGVVDDHRQLAEVVTTIKELLVYEFDHAGDRVVRSAADLVARP